MATAKENPSAPVDKAKAAAPLPVHIKHDLEAFCVHIGQQYPAQAIPLPDRLCQRKAETAPCLVGGQQVGEGPHPVPVSPVEIGPVPQVRPLHLGGRAADHPARRADPTEVVNGRGLHQLVQKEKANAIRPSQRGDGEDCLPQGLTPLTQGPHIGQKGSTHGFGQFPIRLDRSILRLGHRVEDPPGLEGGERQKDRQDQPNEPGLQSGTADPVE